MRYLRALLFAFPLLAFGAKAACQTYSPEQWEAMRAHDMRFWPKYGGHQKSEAQLASDREFVTATMGMGNFGDDRTAASDHLIVLGFNYLGRKDQRTAMFRFNQAFLLDSSNAAVHRGYAAVLMAVGLFDEAGAQFEEGRALRPNDPALLADHASWYLRQYDDTRSADPQKATVALDSASVLLHRSLELEPDAPLTLFRSAVVSSAKGECVAAWEFHDRCVANGGEALVVGFLQDLQRTCPR